MDTKKGNKLSPILLYTIPFSCLLIISILSEILVLFGANNNFIYLLFFPIAEEYFKFYASRRFKNSVFIAIIIFAVYEVILVKIPIIYATYDNNILVTIALITISFNFHITTAFVYKSNLFLINSFKTFLAMSLFHSFFNFLGGIIISDYINLFLLLFASIIPYLWLYAARHNSKSKNA